MSSVYVSPFRSNKNEVFPKIFNFSTNVAHICSGIQILMLILISGSKNGFEDDYGQSDTKKTHKKHRFLSLFGRTPLGNIVTMATAKAPR